MGCVEVVVERLQHKQRRTLRQQSLLLLLLLQLLLRRIVLMLLLIRLLENLEELVPQFEGYPHTPEIHCFCFHYKLVLCRETLRLLRTLSKRVHFSSNPVVYDRGNLLLLQLLPEIRAVF